MTPKSPDVSKQVSEVLGLNEDGRGHRRARYWIGALALLTVLGGAGVLLAPSKENGIQYKTAEVKRGDLTVRVTATGKLEPVNQVDVGTEVSGTIESVAVDYNDRVSAGEVLARLDTDQLEARHREAEAVLALARARVLEAQATVTETGNKLRRTEDMINKKLASPEELDTAAAAHKRAEALLVVAQAQVAQAQAQLDADTRALEKAVIRAPINGIVLERKVEPGQTVAASLQTPVLFTLAENLAQMELHVDVDEADVGQVAAGQHAEFTVDAYPDRSFPAEITQVRFAPQTVEGVVTYETLLSVDNVRLLLRPGMTATADITVDQLQDALLVPNAALRFTPPAQRLAAGRSRGLVGMLLPRHPPRAAKRPAENGKKGGKRGHVWVLRDGKPVSVPITAGATDGVVTQIVAGQLEAGEQVLIDAVTPGGGT
ncbi:MAG: efflux RND transporter periplasmic adaptor subunit [Chromatiaceae bacterium]